MTDKNITCSTVNEKIKRKETFVLNIVANWCSDCTKQKTNLVFFEDAIFESKLELFQLIAQRNRGEFVNLETEVLIKQLGGHGYPRLVLFKDGEIASHDNVEIISQNELSKLAQQFLLLT